ncbi:MAG: hypothetical protein ACOWWO_12885 [Peptococcaceae bacterium]
MEISLPVFVFMGIPEGIALATLAFTILDLKVSLKYLFLVGTTLSTVVYLLRLLPITFGVHTIISILVLFFILNILFKANVILSIMVSLTTYLILILSETISIIVCVKIFNLTQVIIEDDLLLEIAIGYPHILLIFLTAYLIDKNILQMRLLVERIFKEL